MEEKLVVKIRSFLGSAAAVLVLATAAPAYAQEAPVEGYGGQAGVTESQTGSGDVAGEQAQRAPISDRDARNVAATRSGGDAAVTAGGGRLPFTGLDLTLILSAGVALLALGLGMRRLTGGANTA